MPAKAHHLCVLIHGLWGNSQHLDYIAQSLRQRYGEDELVVLSCKSNTSFATYDGAEIGAERVMREIENRLEELSKDGHHITRMSVVGYSLGGIIARYVVGLLDHNGYFDRIQPANFTTFATPHLGVRTPLLGYTNHLWNVLGARTISASGRQLFAIDDFRNTGRPLLAVLADPASIFLQALSRFERRTLYANIVNDRSAVYYTTGISKTDPYTRMDDLKLNYVEGYESVILDPDRPYELAPVQASPTIYQRVRDSSFTLFRRLPIYLAVSLLIPVGIVAFLVNSSVQTWRSRRRIMLHESTSGGNGFGMYKMPYMVDEVRAGFEHALRSTAAAHEPDCLHVRHGMPVLDASDASDNNDDPQAGLTSTANHTSEVTSASRSREKVQEGDVVASEAGLGSIDSTPSHERSPPCPTLALTDQQFRMIDALDGVGFHKYPVHIHGSRHSHAAIIVRHPRRAFDDGKVVIRHWLDKEFKI